METFFWRVSAAFERFEPVLAFLVATFSVVDKEWVELTVLSSSTLVLLICLGNVSIDRAEVLNHISGLAASTLCLAVLCAGFMTTFNALRVKLLFSVWG